MLCRYVSGCVVIYESLVDDVSYS